MADIRKILYFPFSFVNVAVILCLGQAALYKDHRHAIAKRFIFSDPSNKNPGPQKNYTGIRVSEGSSRVIYYHEQTIAVLELEEGTTLINCELMEVRTRSDKNVTLKALQEIIPTQTRIKFADMNDLMQHCQELGFPKITGQEVQTEDILEPIKDDSKIIVSIFKGVFPGTKWCGAGDLASTYYDLGSQQEVDKCCRTHDYCPVKVLGFRQQYKLTNYAPYTKSHCECDKMFYKCLKKVGSNLSDLIGNIYFNLAKPLCVEDVLAEDNVKILQRKFVNNIIPY